MADDLESQIYLCSKAQAGFESGTGSATLDRIRLCSRPQTSNTVCAINLKLDSWFWYSWRQIRTRLRLQVPNSENQIAWEELWHLQPWLAYNALCAEP